MANYDPVNNNDQYAIVYALPGTYSPTANGETLPIEMRDRVHVQGVGARRCVVRGLGTVTNPALSDAIVLPVGPTASMTTTPTELLVDWTLSTPSAPIPGTSQPPPWYPSGLVAENAYWYSDTPEVFDGFTLQGGGVQMYLTNGINFANDYCPAARISNCVFDLRHNIGQVGLAGPSIGILMSRKATFNSGIPNAVPGYYDSRVLVAHNTFIFARWNDDDPLAAWSSESRPEAVGIIDVTENCNNAGDPDGVRRGVGTPCLVANVFRTRGLQHLPPSQQPAIRPFAMLGIGDEDTRVLVNGFYKQANAFDPARVGSTNGFYFSVPVASSQVNAASRPWPVWNCHVAPNGGPNCGTLTTLCQAGTAPTAPTIHIWDGIVGLDPAFVGEYLATNYPSELVDYVDWRILPGSPLEDKSIVPPAGGPRAYFTEPHPPGPTPDTSLWRFDIANPEDLYLFSWDGEHWGNLRVMNDYPDIGFDERGLLIQAGNWANDSNSHNQPGFMHTPWDTPVGGTVRYFILPPNAGGISLTASGRHLRLQEVTTAPPAPSAGDGWINPPGSQAHPTNLASLPFGYRAKYLNYSTTPWQVHDLEAAPLVSRRSLASAPPLQPLNIFVQVAVTDDECPGGVCSHTYFNLQGIIVDGATSTQALLRSNMTGEYR